MNQFENYQLEDFVQDLFFRKWVWNLQKKLHRVSKNRN